MTNRRDFIKQTSLGLAATALPVTALAATEPYTPKPMRPYSKFNPEHIGTGNVINAQPKFYSPLHTPSWWGPHWGLNEHDRFKHNITIYNTFNPQIHKHIGLIQHLASDLNLRNGFPSIDDNPYLGLDIELAALKYFLFGDLFVFNSQKFFKSKTDYTGFNNGLKRHLRDAVWTKNPWAPVENLPCSLLFEVKHTHTDEVIILTCDYNGKQLPFDITEYCEHLPYSPNGYTKGLFQHMRIPNTHGLYTDKSFEEVNAEELNHLRCLNGIIDRKLSNRPSEEEIQNGSEDFYRGNLLDDAAFISWRSKVYAFVRKYQDAYQKVFGEETHV